MSPIIIFSWESFGVFASCEFTEILSTFRSGIPVTARDVPVKISDSVEAVRFAISDSAFDFSLVRFDVFAIMTVSFDVFHDIKNWYMMHCLLHHTYLNSCRWK